MSATEISEILESAGPVFDGGTPKSREDIAREWDEYGFSPNEVRRWVEARCWDAMTADRLKTAGFRPGTDELSWNSGTAAEYEPDAMYQLCNGDVRLDDLTF